MTHNQNTQPIQCHYAVLKENIKSISTDAHVKSPHFPIYLQIKDNYFKIQFENNLYLPISYYEFQTKAHPLDNIHQQKNNNLKINTHSRNLPYHTTNGCYTEHKLNRTFHTILSRRKLFRTNKYYKIFTSSNG